ncbi:MAG TPA: flagellar export protein FliJ [Thiobacillaceae bacterium]|nr:flagellar export protein FliJ [Thiobacillaceae bacterium]
MAKEFPLQPLLEYSQHRMDSAERTLLMLKQREEKERQRLRDLLDYRREYQDRLSGNSAAGMPIHLLRDYQVFLAKVGQAIHQQEQAVDQAHARWQQAHEHWLSQRQKVKAYETLAQRHHNAEMQRLEKRDQRISDEQAVKRFLYNPDNRET